MATRKTKKKPQKKQARKASKKTPAANRKRTKSKPKSSSKTKSKSKKIVAKPRSPNPRKKGSFTIVAKLKPHLNLGPTPALADEDQTASVIMKRLRETLAPSRMNLTNTSSQHAGHRSAQKHGGAHYELAIVSDSFVGLNLVQREQWVTGLLKDLYDSKKIHALSMTLKTSEEEVGF